MVAQPGHRQHGPRLVAEGDQGDGIVVAQFVGEGGERALHQAEPVGGVHRAGDVDDEGEGGGRPFGGGRRGSGRQADPDQRPVAALGAGPRPVHGDGEPVVLRARVALPEAVDELLGAYGPGIGQPAVLDRAARVSVGGGVHVQGEGGQVVGRHGPLRFVRLPLPVRRLRAALRPAAFRAVPGGGRGGRSTAVSGGALGPAPLPRAAREQHPARQEQPQCPSVHPFPAVYACPAIHPRTPSASSRPHAWM